MKKWILGVALAALAAFAWALPSLQDVEAQVAKGNYTQAESMMKEVVAAKPNSARAHYVYAEILAHDGNVARASEEARLARQLDPDVKFTTPEKFRAFETALERAQAPRSQVMPPVTSSTTTTNAAPAQRTMAPAQASSGVPGWVWLVGLAAIAFFLWRGFSRSRATAAGAMASPGFAGGSVVPNAAMQPGMTPGMPYGAGYPAQRPGVGLAGVGLAAAGGVAAGMLADQLIHRGREGGNNVVDNGGNAQPGFFDSPSNAGNEFADRPIDFGTGGNDWDSGGSIDVGGGSDGGSWD